MQINVVVFVVVVVVAVVVVVEYRARFKFRKWTGQTIQRYRSDRPPRVCGSFESIAIEFRL